MENQQELTLAFVAQILMDLFYQEFKAEEDFFDEEHFIFVVRAAFAKLMDIEAEKSRQINKQETGYFTISLSNDWLISETVEFKRAGKHLEGKLSQPPYAFPFDIMGFAVQTVEQPDANKFFKRISPDEIWKFAHLQHSGRVFYAVRRDTIKLVYLKHELKAEVWYAPSLIGDPEKVLIPIGKHLDIVNLGLAALRQATQGAVINKTNNQNTNEALQTEIDAAVSKL